MQLDQRRPNVICDCVTLDRRMRTLLAQNDSEKGGSLVSIIAAYRGEAGYGGIAERADTRARNHNAAPADKARFVETNSLFKGHANASQYLLSSIPENTVTAVFDTNVDRTRGEAPAKIAIIDSKNHNVEITNLRVMSEFLNKKNLNTDAQHPVELILKQPRGSGAEKSLVTAPLYKAKAVLDLVTGNPPYSVTLKDNRGTVYASLESDSSGRVKLQVLNFEAYKEQVDSFTSPQAKVLREITLQTAETSAIDSSEAEAVMFCKTLEERMGAEEEAMRAEAQKPTEYKRIDAEQRKFMQALRDDYRKHIEENMNNPEESNVSASVTRKYSF